MLRCAPLQSIAPHFFTVASLELRDDPGEWHAVAERAGVPPDGLRLLNQVHGRTVVEATASDRWERPQADAVVSSDPAAALVVRVADCAPILIADRRLGVVSAVHAGWRSTMQRIVIAAVDQLTAAFGSRPDDLVAAIGPSLGSCCGEMGEEVVDAFRDAGHDRSTLDRWFVREPNRRPHFDLWQANRDQLEASGLPPDAIHVSRLCTRTHPDIFHSYRSAGSGAGRMAAVIRANPPA